MNSVRILQNEPGFCFRHSFCLSAISNGVKYPVRALKMAVKLWQAIPKAPHCRFYPSCSQYFMLSLDKYGLIQGSIKGFFRILRCHPFSKGGVDFP